MKYFMSAFLAFCQTPLNAKGHVAPCKGNRTRFSNRLCARCSLFSFRAVLKLINTPAQRTFIEKERYVTSLRTAAKETKPGERKKFLPRVWEKLIKKHRRGVGYNLLFRVPPSTLNQTWSVKCRELVTLTRPNKTPTIQIRHRLFTDLKVGWSAFNY